MNGDLSQRSYRRAAVEDASPAGLIVILYDLLVDDLQAAIHAIRGDDIEARSRNLKHALLVLQLLEGTLDREQGGAAARSLAAFYSYLRGQLLNAQFRNDDEVLTRQIALIFDVREAWRTIEKPRMAADVAITPSPVLTAPCDDPDLLDSNQWSA